MTLEISRFAPKEFPHIEPIVGLSSAALSCGLKSEDQPDLLLLCTPPGTAVAGVFTQSSVTSAPVQWCKRSVRAGLARALAVHSGNANVLTGRQGQVFVERVCEKVASSLGCGADEVLIAGTGIIGERISDEQVLGRLPTLLDEQGPVDWRRAADAIRTTDTFPKASSRSFMLGDQRVVVSGIAKGSGMIAPDMATMLCFLFTNADVGPVELHQVLTYANMHSFQRISVDGDESTSDTMLAFATREVDVGSGADHDSALTRLRETMAEVAFDLAMQVVADGEGISKLIKVTVGGARTQDDAYRMAKCVAESPLVKTAFGGGHPNWGRVAMAIGKSHRPVDQERLAIWLGGHQVCAEGDENPSLDNAALAKYMQADAIDVIVDVGMGNESGTVWTCDLTNGYVDINAHYMT